MSHNKFLSPLRRQDRKTKLSTKHSMSFQAPITSEKARHSTLIGVPVLIRKIPNAEQTNKTSLFQFALEKEAKKAAAAEEEEEEEGRE